MILQGDRHRLLALAAAAALGGCAGGLRNAEPELRTVVPPEQAPIAMGAAHVRGEEVRREDRGRLARRIRAEVARRMPGHDPETHMAIARTVLAEARAAGLDPLLVLAVIHVESAFDPDALSRSGAVGLMQLLEPTLVEELQRAGIACGDPSDPIANVQAGVRYLRRLVSAFGEVEVALMAYNAGPRRILGFLREGEIPERFHSYPQRVLEELDRLRSALQPGEATAESADPKDDRGGAA